MFSLSTPSRGKNKTYTQLTQQSPAFLRRVIHPELIVIAPLFPFLSQRRVRSAIQTIKSLYPLRNVSRRLHLFAITDTALPRRGFAMVVTIVKTTVTRETAATQVCT